MRRKNLTVYVDILCKECGNLSLFQHTPSKMFPSFSVTTAWCYKCKKITDHYILNDFDVSYRKLKITKELTDNEKDALHIIESNNSKKLVKKYEK